MNQILRFDTEKAILELAEELEIVYDSSMQDWPYEVADKSDINKYILHYTSLEDEDEDKKLTLMKVILQALVDQDYEEQILIYWAKIKPFLLMDYVIHEFSIKYWSKLTSENFDNCKYLSPLLTDIIKKQLKILYVCTINRMRSATAHKIYEKDNRFEVKSAGTDKTANVLLSTKLLNWADSIIVMEKHHRNHIRKHFPKIYESKKIVCLYIPDNYDYMQPELINLLKSKIEDVYRRNLI